MTADLLQLAAQVEAGEIKALSIRQPYQRRHQRRLHDEMLERIGRKGLAS